MRGRARRCGDAAGARALNDPLQDLHKHLFIEANPIPVKWAVEQMGLIQPGIRLPLTPLSHSAQTLVSDAMAAAGLTH